MKIQEMIDILTQIRVEAGDVHVYYQIGIKPALFTDIIKHISYEPLADEGNGAVFINPPPHSTIV